MPSIVGLVKNLLLSQAISRPDKVFVEPMNIDLSSNGRRTMTEQFRDSRKRNAGKVECRGEVMTAGVRAKIGNFSGFGCFVT